MKKTTYERLKEAIDSLVEEEKQRRASFNRKLRVIDRLAGYLAALPAPVVYDSGDDRIGEVIGLARTAVDSANRVYEILQVAEKRIELAQQVADRALAVYALVTPDSVSEETWEAITLLNLAVRAFTASRDG